MHLDVRFIYENTYYKLYRIYIICIEGEPNNIIIYDRN